MEAELGDAYTDAEGMLWQAVRGPNGEVSERERLRTAVVDAALKRYGAAGYLYPPLLRRAVIALMEFDQKKDLT